MARYDEWWDGPRPAWEPADSGFARPRRFGAGEGPSGWDREQYDEGGEWMSRRVYGPERYGLGPYHERLRRRRRPDADVERDVKDALFYDTWVDADAISVEVSDGVVTLRGDLPSYDEIRYANDDAWDVDGVVGVQSELQVRE
jgi:hypothetical protein